MSTILKTTSKGQLTIPINFRKKFNTDKYIATIKNNKIEIKPLIIKNDDTKTEEITVFDAILHNKGKGIKAKDLVSILKKSV